MTLPFSADAILEVLRRYNEGVWPAQPESVPPQRRA
jgi:hypothetical protein